MSSAASAAPAAAPTISTIYLGLDVHKDSVTIAVLPAGAPSPTRIDKLPNDPARLRRYLDRLAPQWTLRCCYEASGAGYVLYRLLRDWGYACDVIAPSLIPQKPGHQRKHHRHDAAQLAHYYRSGDLTAIRIPTEAEERVRDVVRCRETLQRELIKSRHFLLKFLARRGFVCREGTNWSRPHPRWLTALARDDSPLTAEDRFVFREYLALFEYKRQRRDALDREIEQLALRPALAAAVGRLQCFRGISVHAAMVLATELGDWRRFTSPRQLAAYLGFVPREDSSGDQERKGSITKAGNAHCRHALIQAAWSYRYVPKVAAHLTTRQVGQPPGVIAHAWKAQQRLHQLRPSQLPQAAARAAAASEARPSAATTRLAATRRSARYGAGTSRSRQIFRARNSSTSRWRGTVDVFRAAGLT